MQDPTREAEGPRRRAVRRPELGDGGRFRVLDGEAHLSAPGLPAVSNAVAGGVARAEITDQPGAGRRAVRDPRPGPMGDVVPGEKARPPVTARSESAPLQLPGQRSCSRWVPWGVPSVVHSSTP